MKTREVSEIYTENERKLFIEFGLYYILDAYQSNPMGAYEHFALYIFRHNITGNAVEAVRRVVKAIYAGNVHRHTPEWDKMIEF